MRVALCNTSVGGVVAVIHLLPAFGSILYVPW
jgi:hypothetical protein